MYSWQSQHVQWREADLATRQVYLKYLWNVFLHCSQIFNTRQ